jgi:hypothetical protein
LERTWARFFDRLDRTSSPSGCWVWKGGLTGDGSGMIRWWGRQWATHRLSFHLFRGPLPPETRLEWTCGDKRCANPAHLIARPYASDATQGADALYRRRLLARLDTTSSPRGCWLWTGRSFTTGYGAMSYRGVPELTHRLAYRLLVGPIPAGGLILHACDVKACCNPEHLRVGDYAANNRDTTERGRRNPPRGEAAGRAKLTNADVRAIRATWPEGGHTYATLGHRYGVSASTVEAVVKRQSWTHI